MRLYRDDPNRPAGAHRAPDREGKRRRGSPPTLQDETVRRRERPRRRLAVASAAAAAERSPQPGVRDRLHPRRARGLDSDSRSPSIADSGQKPSLCSSTSPTVCTSSAERPGLFRSQAPSATTNTRISCAPATPKRPTGTPCTRPGIRSMSAAATNPQHKPALSNSNSTTSQHAASSAGCENQPRSTSPSPPTPRSSSTSSSNPPRDRQRLTERSRAVRAAPPRSRGRLSTASAPIRTGRDEVAERLPPPRLGELVDDRRAAGARPPHAGGGCCRGMGREGCARGCRLDGIMGRAAPRRTGTEGSSAARHRAIRHSPHLEAEVRRGGRPTGPRRPLGPVECDAARRSSRRASVHLGDGNRRDLLAFRALDLDRGVLSDLHELEASRQRGGCVVRGRGTLLGISHTLGAPPAGDSCSSDAALIVPTLTQECSRRGISARGYLSPLWWGVLFRVRFRARG